MNKFGYSNIMPIRETFGMGGGNSQFLYIVQKVEGSLKKSQTFHSRFSLYIFEWGVDFGSREGSKCFGGGNERHTPAPYIKQALIHSNLRFEVNS